MVVQGVEPKSSARALNTEPSLSSSGFVFFFNFYLLFCFHAEVEPRVSNREDAFMLGLITPTPPHTHQVLSPVWQFKLHCSGKSLSVPALL